MIIMDTNKINNLTASQVLKLVRKPIPYSAETHQKTIKHYNVYDPDVELSTYDKIQINSKHGQPFFKISPCITTASGKELFVALIYLNKHWVVSDLSLCHFNFKNSGFLKLIPKKQLNKFKHAVIGAKSFLRIESNSKHHSYYIVLPNLNSLANAYQSLLSFEFYYYDVLDFLNP